MGKQHFDVLFDGLVNLRPLESTDLLKTLEWRNRDDIRIWFLNPTIINLDDHITWFNHYLELDNDYIYIIEYAHQPVGQISLYNIDIKNKSGEFGRFMIGEDSYRGKGISRIATNLLLSFGFDTLNLQNIFLEVKKDNFAALKVYSSCGFKFIVENNNTILMCAKNNNVI